MDEIPKKDRLLSSRYYEIGTEWVDLDAAARSLEECKSAVLSQRKKALGNIPDSRAETEVKASETWMTYLTQMVDARTKANYAKVKLETIRMRHAEQQSKEATARHEARLDR